jgi:NADPH2:quinone reductase
MPSDASRRKTQGGTPTKNHPVSLPATMTAIAIERFGGPEVLSLRSLPVPVPEEDEVLIAVDTAGVGSWDADIRDGSFTNGRTHFPLVLGTDGSGIVKAVGSRVRRLNVGDRVYAYSWENPKGGFYAEYVAVPAKTAAHIPERFDLEHAGAIPTTGLTALQGIDDALHVKKGENIAIHGAAGGVGTLAVQFAKLRGARVLATVSSDDRLAFVRGLGADIAVNGKQGDIAGAAQHFAPGGIDAVLGLTGGETLERLLDTVRPGGRLAYPNGIDPEPRKRHETEVTPYDAIAGVEEFERFARVLDAMNLEIPMEAYPLAEAAKAHERLAAGHLLGKIVVRIA